MFLGVRGSHVTTFVMVVHSAIDKAIFVCLFWAVVLSVLPAWIVPYFYPPRQGGLVWGALLAFVLVSGCS